MIRFSATNGRDECPHITKHRHFLQEADREIDKIHVRKNHHVKSATDGEAEHVTGGSAVVPTAGAFVEETAPADSSNPTRDSKSTRRHSTGERLASFAKNHSQI